VIQIDFSCHLVILPFNISNPSTEIPDPIEKWAVKTNTPVSRHQDLLPDSQIAIAGIFVLSLVKCCNILKKEQFLEEMDRIIPWSGLN
jgi:hypothetical protein